MPNFRQQDHLLIWEQGQQIVQIEPWGHDSLRARATLGLAVHSNLPQALIAPPHTRIGIAISPDRTVIRNGLLAAEMTAEGALRFYNTSTGVELLVEAPDHFTLPPPRSFKHEQGFYEGMREEGEEEIISLCRSGWTGSQRYAAALWSGDIPSTFEALQAQVRAGLNVGLSGIPWWTMLLAHQKGAPPMRPLFFDFPQDPTSWAVEDQFMFGPDLLVAPVLFEGDRCRQVYLPDGATWTDAWSDQQFSGGQTITANAPLACIPLYLRDGAKLPIHP
jgi:hypothetical protein